MTKEEDLLDLIARLKQENHELKVALAESQDDFNEITSVLEKQGLVWDDELFMYIKK